MVVLIPDHCLSIYFVVLVRTHCQDLFFITVKYHDNIPKSIKVLERKLHLKQTRGNNSKSMNATFVILLCDTL